jgi:hypothetical protein
MLLKDSGGSAYQSQVPAVARAWSEKQKELTKPAAATPKSSATPVPQTVQNYMAPKFQEFLDSEPKQTPLTETPLPASLQPSDPELQLMTSQGWALPSSLKKDVERASKKSDSELTPLSEFTYTADDAEVALIREKYTSDEAKAYGYGLPAKASTGDAATLAAGVPMSQIIDAMYRGEPAVTSAQLTVKNEAAPMSWEEWEALSPDQQRAVEFNTLLVETREKDLNTKNIMDLSKEDRQKYDDQVLEMFGPGGGSETYAPNTVNLLAQVDFKAVGQDLDEYLSLERAVDVDELKDFKLEPGTVEQLSKETIPGRTIGYGTALHQEPSRILTNYAEVRSPENLQTLDSVVVNQFSDVISAAMTSSERAAWDVLSAFSDRPLGSYTSEEVPLGYGNMNLRAGTGNEGVDEYIQNAYSHLLDPANTNAMQEVQEDLKNLDPEHQQAFWDYFNMRTRNELNYGPIPMVDEAGLDITGPMRTAEELRLMAGLGD